ncbi:hypothetical protein, conserved in T. vivax [Trypanosoma vivax Y486]|uniref:Uncharacterized protein n=1 Tax=Trypanosoma vivax (strain Y486) TaxID=1055687 RepID=F9WL63_TRYVY|nr:hypothetical protein, conserved in T. vivax [Trypanosoma vivax Y486]|eukprot:CCD18250.1 hypothetical protein, conserved in T. vivax [Trypanosoma vivax Y486]
MRAMLHLAPPHFPIRFTSVLVRLSSRCCRFPRSPPQKTLFFARFAFTAASSLLLCVSLFTRAAGRARPSSPMPLNALSASFAPLDPRPGLCARFLCQSPLTHFLPPPCPVQTARWLVVRLLPFCPSARLRLRKDLLVPPCAKKSPEHTVNALFPPNSPRFALFPPPPFPLPPCLSAVLSRRVKLSLSTFLLLSRPISDPLLSAGSLLLPCQRCFAAAFRCPSARASCALSASFAVAGNPSAIHRPMRHFVEASAASLAFQDRRPSSPPPYVSLRFSLPSSMPSMFVSPTPPSLGTADQKPLSLVRAPAPCTQSFTSHTLNP